MMPYAPIGGVYGEQNQYEVRERGGRERDRMREEGESNRDGRRREQVGRGERVEREKESEIP